MTVFASLSGGGTADPRIRGRVALLQNDAAVGALVTTLRATLRAGGAWSIAANANFSIDVGDGEVRTKIAAIPVATYAPLVTYEVTTGARTHRLTEALDIRVIAPPALFQITGTDAATLQAALDADGSFPLVLVTTGGVPPYGDWQIEEIAGVTPPGDLAAMLADGFVFDPDSPDQPFTRLAQ